MSSQPLLWLSLGGFLMALLALSGSLVVWLEPECLRRLLPGLVGVASGSLIGGALFHMIPVAFHHTPSTSSSGGPMTWVALGFVMFLGIELMLRGLPGEPRVDPQVPLILLGDGMHNLLGGLSVGTAFLLDPAAGVAAWIAAAAHEIPQELGDFGVLVDGGLNTRRALAANFASALTFPLGALASLWAPDHLPLPALVSIGAGSFLYLAAVDLLPDVVRAQARRARLTGVASVVAGILLMGAIPHSHPPHGDNHNEPSSELTCKKINNKNFS